MGKKWTAILSPGRRGWAAIFCMALSLGLAACSGEPSGETVAEGDPATQPAPPAEPALDPQTLPEVVARVNGAEIKQSDLVARAKAVAGSPDAPPQEGAGFYREVLNDLVNAELLFQESVDKGYAPSPKEVDERVAAIRGRFPSESEFKNALARQGLTPEKMRDALRRDLGIERMLQKEIISTVSIDETAARAFFDENQEKMRSEGEVRVSHILVKADRGASASEKAAARKKAEQLRKQVLAGEDFAELARRNSDDPGSKELGGDLSWFGRGTMAKPFEEAAYALEPDEVSPVVSTPFGFHVLKMTDRRPGKPLTFEETKDQIAAYLKEKAIQDQIGARVQDLREKAKLEILL